MKIAFKSIAGHADKEDFGETVIQVKVIPNLFSPDFLNHLLQGCLGIIHFSLTE